MEEFLKVGVVTSPHGVHGDVKVFPTTDEPARFRKLQTVFLDDAGQDERRVSAVRFVKNLVVLHLSGVDSMDEAQTLRQRELFVHRENALPLGKDEYYIADLIGAAVETDDGEELGTLREVLQTGANDVYIVDAPAYGEVLIPAIKQCILKVDVTVPRVCVHLLPGLLPEKKEVES